MAMKITKDDKVVVITGKDKGKEGKVMQAMPEKGKVIVSGVNVVTKPQRPQSAKSRRTLKKEASYRRFKRNGRLQEVRQSYESRDEVRRR